MKAKPYNDGTGDCIDMARVYAPQTITLTTTDQREWARCAQAMFANGCNAAGHALSVNAARGGALPIHRYDELAAIYRAWLCFNEYPSA